jgi:hypothetical protein
VNSEEINSLLSFPLLIAHWVINKYSTLSTNACMAIGQQTIRYNSALGEPVPI